VVDVTSTTGASPVTMTDSFAASCICRLTVAVASSATVAVFCTTPKPERLPETLY